MFLARKCCCCQSLKIGCIIIGIVGILMSLFNIWSLVTVLHITSLTNNQTKHTGFLFTSEFLMLLASVILLVATVTKEALHVLIYVVLASVQTFCILIYSIVSCAYNINVISNINIFACVIYWVLVTFSSSLSIYFVYIAISYYEEKKNENQSE